MTVEGVISDVFQGEDQSLIQALIEILSIEQYKKGQVIYESGMETDGFYILVSGIAYTYLLDSKQQLNTTCFFSEKYDFLNIEGIGVKTCVGARALVDSEICIIPVDQAKLLSEQYPSLIWKYIRGLQKMMLYLCVVNNQRMSLSSEDCYRWFCQKWPIIDKLASNQQIASFLRIRPESLSRLRRQIKENETDHKVISNILVSKDLQSNYLDIRKTMDKNSKYEVTKK